MNILNIDAWRFGGGWNWNNWYKIGEMSKDNMDLLNNTRKLLNYLRKKDILSENSKGMVSVEDDGYNVVIKNKNTLEPLIAIEYGADLSL